jgi:hypothetical protein
MFADMMLSSKVNTFFFFSMFDKSFKIWIDCYAFQFIYLMTIIII